MKKTYKLIALLLIAVTLLCSCSTTVVETTVLPTAQSTPTPMPTSIEDIGQIIYELDREEDYLRETEYTKKSKKYINSIIEPRSVEEDTQKKLVWNFQGIDINLEYKWSSALISFNRLSDMYVDYYTATTDIRYVHIDDVVFKHGTTEPIEFKISANKEQLNLNIDTLAEYINYIGEIAGDSVDLDKYEMTCSTTINNSTEEIVKDVFHPAEDYEQSKRYAFRFVAKNGENMTGNIITVSFAYIPMGSTDTVIISYRNESSDYEYNEIIPVTKSELEYSHDMVEEYVAKNIKKYDDLKFSMIDVLYGKTYLVYQYKNRDNHHAYDLIYIDYQRLQWKMALEGRT